MNILKKTSFWRCILIGTLILSLIPICWIAIYNHSCADDLSYGELTRYAWVHTGSFAEVLKATLQQIKNSYFSWQGTYSAIALFTLHPGIWGEDFYFLSTYILLGVFLFSNFYFFRTVLRNFSDRTDIADIISCVVCLLSIQLLPSAVQGFFWWNGSSFYVIFYSLLLIQLAVFSKICFENSCSLKRCFLSSILGIIIAGGNYITALLVAELSFCVLLYSMIRKKTYTKKIFIITITSMLSLLVNVLAPGNALRQQHFTSVAMHPVKAILYSFHEAYVFLGRWNTPFLFAGLLFLVPFFVKLCTQSKYRIKIPSLLLTLCFIFALFASSFTPTLYAMGSEGPGRVQNIRFFFFILLMILSEGIVIYYLVMLSQRADDGFLVKSLLPSCTPKMIGCFLVGIIAIVSLFCIDHILVGNKNTITTISAIRSLHNGEAREYDEIADQRIQQLLSDQEAVYLAPFSKKPYVLFFDDIQPDSDDWRNRAMARFYEKTTVYLKEESKAPTQENRK